MRGKFAVAVAALFLMSAAPVSAQATCENPTACPNVSTPTSLYFHIFDVFNNFPINTQEPHPGFFKVGGTNFPTVVEPTSGTNYDFNSIFGYSTSGLVEYGFIENGQPRFHPERGIAKDVVIDGGAQVPCGAATAPACVHLYISVRDMLGGQSMPNFMPYYTFKVQVREKNVLKEEELATANPIMQGELTYHLASKDFASQNGTKPFNDNVEVRVPNSDGIVEYAIPMTIDSPRIPKTDAYHVRIDWYQNPSGDAGNNDKAAEGYMRLVMDETYHPRLDMNIMNPVYIDFIHPEVAAGIVLIHTAENSPWGTYDVDVDNITVVVKDEAGNQIFPNLQQVVSQNAHVHDLHDKSAEVTYLWRFRDEGVPDGRYSITVSVQNRAHTATATDTATFVLEGKKAYGIDEGGNEVTVIPESDSAESSPGAGMLVLAAILGVALLQRRRRA